MLPSDSFKVYEDSPGVLEERCRVGKNPAFGAMGARSPFEPAAGVPSCGASAEECGHRRAWFRDRCWEMLISNPHKNPCRLLFLLKKTFTLLKPSA